MAEVTAQKTKIVVPCAVTNCTVQVTPGKDGANGSKGDMNLSKLNGTLNASIYLTGRGSPEEKSGAVYGAVGYELKVTKIEPAVRFALKNDLKIPPFTCTLKIDEEHLNSIKYSKGDVAVEYSYSCNTSKSDTKEK